jgi:outer membrane phospholipase A
VHQSPGSERQSLEESRWARSRVLISKNTDKAKMPIKQKVKIKNNKNNNLEG